MDILIMYSHIIIIIIVVVVIIIITIIINIIFKSQQYEWLYLYDNHR